MLLVTAGKISLLAEDDEGGHRRFTATLSPGMTPGDLDDRRDAAGRHAPRRHRGEGVGLTAGDLEVLRARNPGWS